MKGDFLAFIADFGVYSRFLAFIAGFGVYSRFTILINNERQELCFLSLLKKYKIQRKARKEESNFSGDCGGGPVQIDGRESCMDSAIIHVMRTSDALDSLGLAISSDF